MLITYSPERLKDPQVIEPTIEVKKIQLYQKSYSKQSIKLEEGFAQNFFYPQPQEIAKGQKRKLKKINKTYQDQTRSQFFLYESKKRNNCKNFFNSVMVRSKKEFATLQKLKEIQKKYQGMPVIKINSFDQNSNQKQEKKAKQDTHQYFNKDYNKSEKKLKQIILPDIHNQKSFQRETIKNKLHKTIEAISQNYQLDKNSVDSVTKAQFKQIVSQYNLLQYQELSNQMQQDFLQRKKNSKFYQSQFEQQSNSYQTQSELANQDSNSKKQNDKKIKDQQKITSLGDLQEQQEEQQEMDSFLKRENDSNDSNELIQLDLNENIQNEYNLKFPSNQWQNEITPIAKLVSDKQQQIQSYVYIKSSKDLSSFGEDSNNQGDFYQQIKKLQNQDCEGDGDSEVYSKKDFGSSQEQYQKESNKRINENNNKTDDEKIIKDSISDLKNENEDNQQTKFEQNRGSLMQENLRHSIKNVKSQQEIAKTKEMKNQQNKRYLNLNQDLWIDKKNKEKFSAKTTYNDRQIFNNSKINESLSNSSQHSKQHSRQQSLNDEKKMIKQKQKVNNKYEINYKQTDSSEQNQSNILKNDNQSFYLNQKNQQKISISQDTDKYQINPKTEKSSNSQLNRQRSDDINSSTNQLLDNSVIEQSYISQFDVKKISEVNEEDSPVIKKKKNKEQFQLGNIINNERDQFKEQILNLHKKQSNNSKNDRTSIIIAQKSVYDSQEKLIQKEKSKNSQKSVNKSYQSIENKDVFVKQKNSDEQKSDQYKKKSMPNIRQIKQSQTNSPQLRQNQINSPQIGAQNLKKKFQRQQSIEMSQEQKQIEKKLLIEKQKQENFKEQLERYRYQRDFYKFDINSKKTISEQKQVINNLLKELEGQSLDDISLQLQLYQQRQAQLATQQQQLQEQLESAIDQLPDLIEPKLQSKLRKEESIVLKFQQNLKKPQIIDQVIRNDQKRGEMDIMDIELEEINEKSNQNEKIEDRKKQFLQDAAYIQYLKQKEQSNNFYSIKLNASEYSKPFNNYETNSQDKNSSINQQVKNEQNKKQQIQNQKQMQLSSIDPESKIKIQKKLIKIKRMAQLKEQNLQQTH